VFSSSFSQHILGFGPSFLQNKTKHHAKVLAKRWLFSILDFGLKRLKKTQKEIQKALMRAINSVF
jgi:hypothetical protein